jgi:hypothetical protein
LNVKFQAIAESSQGHSAILPLAADAHADLSAAARKSLALKYFYVLIIAVNFVIIKYRMAGYVITFIFFRINGAW